MLCIIQLIPFGMPAFRTFQNGNGNVVLKELQCLLCLPHNLSKHSQQTTMVASNTPPTCDI
jgi:hypothetical protein